MPLVFTVPVPVKVITPVAFQVNLDDGRVKPAPVPAPFVIATVLDPAKVTLPEPVVSPEALILPTVTAALRVTVTAVFPLMELLSKIASSPVPGVVVVTAPPVVVLHAPAAFHAPDVGPVATVPPGPIQNFCGIFF